jgi:hypothetical protein
MPEKSILVTGDCIIERHIYEEQSSACITKIVDQGGGAMMLAELLEQSAAKEKDRQFTVICGVDDACRGHFPQALSLWNVRPSKGKSDKKTWDYTRSLGCSGLITPMPQQSAVSPQKADIIVIHESGLYFRHGTNSNLWPAAIKGDNIRECGQVLLSMAAPLAQGDLWRALVGKCREKLTVVVSLADILKEETGIPTGISWERTLEALTSELQSNGAISDLLKCSNLIVRIGSAGALWVNPGAGGPTFTAIIDPTRQESNLGEDRDEIRLTFAAAIALRLTEGGSNEIPLGIRSGIKAIRDLADLGYVQNGKESPSFPFAEIASSLASNVSSLVSIPMPVNRMGDPRPWSIMGDDLGNNHGIARRVALFGPRALGDIPYSLFGKLTVVDRGEIESLSGIRQLMKGYVAKKKTERPLSIAVFGAPGSGKSFGIKQIGKEILGPDCVILEFNLSQFAGPGELVGALHQVRDKVLEGTVPLVFWDEFDSKEYIWLQSLLAPMQDGKFQEGQITHPIGKCIFIFAGGTSYTMQDFAPADPGSEAARKFKLVKGPDFVSRLNGYLNVLGPNPRQRFDREKMEWVNDDIHPDHCYPIRRALLIRAMLGLKPEQTLEIDQGVLTALLEIDCYKHGARSLETVLNLTKRDSSHLLRSNLPPEEQLSLHVEYDKFKTLVNRDLPFRMKAEWLAPHIHKFYRQLCSDKGWDFTYDMDYELLTDEIKSDNIAAAARIPSILHLAGLRLNEKGSGKALPETEYQRIITPLLEKLAEAEHNGWMEQKYRNDWRFGEPRNDSRKIHNALVEYKKLSEEDKDKDRDSVNNFNKIVAKAGYIIVKVDVNSDAKPKKTNKNSK